MLRLHRVPGDGDKIHAIHWANRARVRLDDRVKHVVAQILINLNGTAQISGYVIL